MERDPWWKNVKGPFPDWEGPIGCKSDGGGCHRASGTVGKMIVHRAVHIRNADAVRAAIAAGENVNEVEAAGCTPLHAAAYEGWLEGAELLLTLGAKINASNNAGDRPWHWAHNMGHTAMLDLLEKLLAQREFGYALAPCRTPTGQAALALQMQAPRPTASQCYESDRLGVARAQHGAQREFGEVLVTDHTPKVKDFFQRECWAHHPKPYADFMKWRAEEDARWAAEASRLIPGVSCVAAGGAA